MKLQTIMLVLALMLAAGCVQLDVDPSSLEETIFGEPLPNGTAPHDHVAHGHEPGSEHNDAHAHEHEHANEAVSETAASAGLEVVLVPSQLFVGHNRMAVGLLDGDRQMIHDAEVLFNYFDLTDPDAPRLEQQAAAYPVQSPEGLTTIFAQERRFDRAGDWGLEVQARLAGGETVVQRIRFNVAAAADAILPGDAAPRLPTPTLADAAGDYSQITSAWEPNASFYRLGLDEALNNGKPTVLLLATPAFCRTRFCGPSYAIATELEAEHGDGVDFLHVEVYTGLPDPAQNNWELSPIMGAFGLTTEPWIYVMDAGGRVVYRAEGLFTPAEIAAHLP